LLRKREAFIYMHMIAKGQMKCARGTRPSAADQFYDLAI
jgi:putative transposase